MKVTIEIDSKKEFDKLSALFKSLEINKVEIVTADDVAIVKGDKTIDPTCLFGIWADKPRNIQDIRNAAWQRNKHVL